MSLEKGVWLLKNDMVSSANCLRTLRLSVSGILSISIEVSSSSGFYRNTIAYYGTNHMHSEETNKASNVNTRTF